MATLSETDMAIAMARLKANALNPPLSAEDLKILKSIPGTGSLIPFVGPLNTYIDQMKYPGASQQTARERTSYINSIENNKLRGANAVITAYKTGGLPAAQSALARESAPANHGGFFSDLGSAFGSLMSSGLGVPIAAATLGASGVLSGAAAGSAGTGVGAGGQLLASSAPIMAPANAAGTGFIGAGAGAGSAGYGAGAGTAFAPTTTPTLLEQLQQTMGLTPNTAAASNAVATAAGGGTGAASTVASPNWLDYISSGLGIASGAVAAFGGNNLNASQIQSMVDPFAPFRPQYAQQLNSLMNNPASVTSLPGYKFLQDQGNQGVERVLSAQGKTSSGAEQLALQKQNEGLANQFYNDQYVKLAQLSGATANPSAGGTAAGTALQNNQQAQQAGLTAVAQGVGSVANYFRGN